MESDSPSSSGAARSASTGSNSDVAATGAVRRWNKVQEAKLESGSSTQELVELTKALQVDKPKLEFKWPYARCNTSGCQTTDKWFRMHCEKV